MKPTTTLRFLLVAAWSAMISPLGFAATKPAESARARDAEVRSLIAALQSPQTGENEKAIACQRLAVIGTKEAVPALAAMLSDEKVAHLARQALEPMPDLAAGAALRAALGKVSGALRIGIIHSIGVRRDAAATAALAAELDGPDQAMTSAAAAALGRIATSDAAKALQRALARADGTQQASLADACLSCAERLAADGQRTSAAAIYDALCVARFPEHIRIAAMTGAILARGREGVALLIDQIRGQDPVMLVAAWRAALELSGNTVTLALAGEFSRLPADKQTALVRVLGERADPAALPAILEAARSSSADVRIAALRALPRVDSKGASAALLLQTVAAPNPAEADAALASLGHIGGTDTDARILASVSTATPATRAKLIGVLGVRRVDSARPELLKQAAGAEPEVSKAAFRALALVATPADLPALIRLSTAGRDDAVGVSADLAVFAVSMKIQPAAQRAEPVLNAFREAKTAQAKCALLRPLGAIVRATGGGRHAFDTVRAALDEKDAAVRAEALRTLAEWPDATPAALLLEIAEREPGNRDVALRGGVRMAANVAAGRDPTQLDYLAWFTRANKLVRTREDKLLIVSGLGSMKRIEALAMLQPYLDDPSIQTEAALAVLEFTSGFAGAKDAPPVRAALEKIVKETKDVDVRRKAGKMAKSLQPGA